MKRVGCHDRINDLALPGLTEALHDWLCTELNCFAVALYLHGFLWLDTYIYIYILPCFAEVGKDKFGDGRGIHAQVFNEVARFLGGCSTGILRRWSSASAVVSARRCLALHLVGGGSCLRLGLASFWVVSFRVAG